MCNRASCESKGRLRLPGKLAGKRGPPCRSVRGAGQGMAGCSLSPSAVGEWGNGIQRRSPKCGLHRQDVPAWQIIQNFFPDMKKSRARRTRYDQGWYGGQSASDLFREVIANGIHFCDVWQRRIIHFWRAQRENPPCRLSRGVRTGRHGGRFAVRFPGGKKRVERDLSRPVHMGQRYPVSMAFTRS